MTNPTLERAARALYRADPENYGTEEDMWPSYVGQARAVLMAVIPELERIEVEEQGPSGRGWLAGVCSPDGEYVRYEDLQAILNDGEGE